MGKIKYGLKNTQIEIITENQIGVKILGKRLEWGLL